ncbi:MAG: GGDEF domain-containing protein [Woeseiaceae bacterium]|nr:GGDEF domain-containing protein [Woeseiaceae bacterium]
MNARVDKSNHRSLWRGDLLFAVSLLIAGAIALIVAMPEAGILTGNYSWGTALFFLLFGLFTILMGYARPGFGHISFDRVAQVSSILVLGPFDAAWIAGLASAIYPLHRVWKGVPVFDVFMASIHNAGMMILVVLCCGSLYAYLGGPIPLTELNLRIGGLILLLGLSMQVMNDGIMAVMMTLRKMDSSSMLNVFSVGVELASVPLAVLVAIVFASMELPVFVLLLFGLSLGMLVLKQFAEMRNKLEALVDERTEELRVKTLELEEQATHDKLTGLFNRRYVDDFLQREIDNANRYNRPFTIALADIDHFKRVNDSHSHAIGDQVLCRVSEILTNRCRKTDVVARYGGEEFLLCFPDTNAEFAEQICSQIRYAVEKTDWSDIGMGIRLTISFGIAETSIGSRPTSILSDADTRLYQAKHKGRNRIVSLPGGKL